MNGYLKNLGTMKEEAWKYDRTQLYNLGIKNMIPEDLVKNNILQVKNGKMAGEYILAENLNFIEGTFVIIGKTIDNDIMPVVVPIFDTIPTNLKLTEVESEILKTLEEYNQVQQMENAFSADAVRYNENDEKSNRYSLVKDKLYTELVSLKAQLKDNRFGLFENAANTKESVVDKIKNFKSESQSAVKESTIKKEPENML